MLTYIGGTYDSQGRVRSRHDGRKERRPGLRERNSGRRERFQIQRPAEILQDRQVKERSTQNTQTARYVNIQQNSARNYSKRRERPVITKYQTKKAGEDQQETTTETMFQECSTIEEIKKEMKRRPVSAPPSHLPDWLVNLDMNLDVTAVDVIPPFEKSRPEADLSFSGSAKFIFLDENYNSNSVSTNSNLSRSASADNVTETRFDANESRMTSPALSERKTRNTTTKQRKPSPRRYQGDKRVMSLQTGGIRSTPMQPKAKKFINQMITYHHMKHHDRKLKAAKPAIDSKMPATFKIALDRKKLIEERLTDSWNSTYDTSLPSHRASPSIAGHYRSSSPKHMTTTSSSALDLDLSPSPDTTTEPTRSLNTTRDQNKSAIPTFEQHVKPTSTKYNRSKRSPSPSADRTSPTMTSKQHVVLKSTTPKQNRRGTSLSQTKSRKTQSKARASDD